MPLVLDTPWLTAWLWITLLLVVGWLKRHLDINRGLREEKLRDPGADSGERQWPPLTVLVAGKDEEANIGTCVRGLLAQDYPALQVIAVNDRSADRTGAILDEIAAGDARLTVVHITDLPAGWFGKNNAMAEGVRHARGAWLCFTDADCTFDSPRLLRAAVRMALDQDIAFLSVLPRLIVSTFWERVVQPVAGAIMLFWNPPPKVNDARSRCAYANGAFMLLRRSAYEQLGGHEPFRATLNEDMHMARAAKRAGLRLKVVQSEAMYSVRMYTGFGQIWRGWSRIFYGCFGTAGRLVASFLVLALFSLSPYITLAVAALIPSAAVSLAVAAGLAIVAQQSILWRFYPLSGIGSAWALTYPLGTILCLGMILNAMRRLGGATTNWRGTVYARGA